MAHTFTNVLVHLVFSTRERGAFISDPIREQLHAYMGGILREVGVLPLMIGGTSDHVHLLTRIPSDLAIADCVRVLKANSSKWVKGKWREKRMFAWQAGYSAFSVSESNRAAVLRYIQDQVAHHTKRSFQDEFITLLQKHGVEFDDRFVWK
jgi:REP element-mobilizing transposase RayT